MWVLYPHFLSEDHFFLFKFYEGGVEARPLLDTRLALYGNNNSIIYLKSNIKKKFIGLLIYIHWQVLINSLLECTDFMYDSNNDINDIIYIRPQFSSIRIWINQIT